MEHAEIIDPGFSVADATWPTFKTADAGLLVSFVDYQANPVKVLFRDAISFRWEAIELKMIDGERYDASHVIQNSEWLKEHLRSHSVTPNERHRHFRLNFNATGTLQVIAEEIIRLSCVEQTID